MKVYDLYFSVNSVKEFNRIEKYIGLKLKAYTILDINGVYNGFSERSWILRVFGSKALKPTLKDISSFIKRIAHQESVLLLELNTKGVLI